MCVNVSLQQILKSEIAGSQYISILKTGPFQIILQGNNAGYCQEHREHTYNRTSGICYSLQWGEHTLQGMWGAECYKGLIIGLGLVWSDWGRISGNRLYSVPDAIRKQRKSKTGFRYKSYRRRGRVRLKLYWLRSSSQPCLPGQGIWSFLWSGQYSRLPVFRHDYRAVGGWGGWEGLPWSIVARVALCNAVLYGDTVYANRRTRRPRGSARPAQLSECCTHTTQHREAYTIGRAVTTGWRHIVWPLPVKLFVSLWDYQVICKVTLCHHANLHFCIVVVAKHASQYFSHRVVGGLHLLPWIWANLWLPCTQ